MAPRPRGAPVFEHSREIPLRNVRQRQVIRYVGQTEPSHGCIAHLEDTVEDELTFHAHLLMPVLFELQAYRPP